MWYMITCKAISTESHCIPFHYVGSLQQVTLLSCTCKYTQVACHYVAEVSEACGGKGRVHARLVMLKC